MNDYPSLCILKALIDGLDIVTPTHSTLILYPVIGPGGGFSPFFFLFSRAKQLDRKRSYFRKFVKVFEKIDFGSRKT